jgi:hypothetical protein
MRRFETGNDQAAEAAARARVERAWRCTVVKRDDLAEVDWAVYRDMKLHCFMEFKRRRHSSGTYPTVFLAERKYRALRDVALRFKVPSYYCIEFDNGTGYIEIDHPSVRNAERVVGGRAWRDGASHDRETLLLVPVRDMVFFW